MMVIYYIIKNQDGCVVKMNMTKLVMLELDL